MNEFSGIMIATLVAIGIYIIGIRWWRHRQAAKLADQLLQDIVKGKDSFRR